MRQIDRPEAERIVNAYADTLLRLCFTYLGSVEDAEDVVQTVFLKLLASGPEFQSPEHEKAWLIRAAVNACKDELRAFRRRAVPMEAIPERPAPEVPASPVLDSVMALPDEYRGVIYLFYYEGYSIREIAELLGRRPSYQPAAPDPESPWSGLTWFLGAIPFIWWGRRWSWRMFTPYWTV